MLLYHGSNLIISEPKLLTSQRALDFGQGFYLTSNLEQAVKWAKTVCLRRQSGRPAVSVFALDDKNLAELAVLRFTEADREWLRFVCDNRLGKAPQCMYDLVIGPVANDNTMPVINRFIGGDYDEDEALKRLLTQKLHDQYVGKPALALAKLQFQREEAL